MGALSNYFKGVGIKRLVKVELPRNPEKGRNSTQHEFNANVQMIPLFGNDRMEDIPATFMYFNNENDSVVTEKNTVTWYDSREKQTHRSAEYRLYYSSTNTTMPLANEGDLLIVGKSLDDSLIIIIADESSTIESQLMWLFGFHEVEDKFQVKDLSDQTQQLGFAGRHILSSLGIEVPDEELDFVELVTKYFGKTFPATHQFSEFSRSTLKDVSVVEEPDKALLAYMQREEALFRALEKIIVQEKLNLGFDNNVDDFISFSLSVQNRRKARAGFAFENHLSFIFNAHNIGLSKGAKTERNNKPDFLFPGISHYNDAAFDVSLLTMLGVKTTAKDRWRQILSEADKIKEKHLITLEPSISTNQTEEMRAKDLQLVVPEEIKLSYNPVQKNHIMTLGDFIKLVLIRQNTM